MSAPAPTAPAGTAAWPRGSGPSLPVALVAAILCVLSMAGCAGIERASQPEARPVVAPAGPTVSIEPAVASSAPVPEPLPTGVAEPAVVTPEPPVAAAVSVTPGVNGPVAAKPEVSAPRVQARAAPPSPAAQPPKKEPPAPVSAKPEAPPPLDLKSLETRLRETKAIGVFTKLTVKNQVDDLLDQFRAYYQGKLKTTLAELRRSYDLLVLKVLALLQDADPPLASAIAASRESIWAILSNPAKFAAV
jgi:hypothetical protein